MGKRKALESAEQSINQPNWAAGG